MVEEAPPGDAIPVLAFIALDRQALLGRLSAGLVHAVNNVLGGIIGQVDLLLLTKGGNELAEDLERIARSCDEGIQFTKSLTRVITSLREPGATDPKGLLQALCVLLGRIFRRAGVKGEMVASGVMLPAARGDLYAQAAFHLLLMAFEGAATDGEGNGTIAVEITGDGEWLFVGLPHLSFRQAVEGALPTDLGSADYHLWMLGRLCRMVGGAWEPVSEVSGSQLIWPVAGSGSLSSSAPTKQGGSQGGVALAHLGSANVQ